MQSLLPAIALSFLLVAAIACAAPLLYAAFTGKFYDRSAWLPIRSYPRLFLRIALLNSLFLTLCILGLIKLLHSR